jgi:hypothetical protein
MSKFTFLGLPWHTIRGLPAPPDVSTMPCDSFYSDPDEMSTNCFSSNLLGYYEQNYRNSVFAHGQPYADSLELLLMYVSPGASRTSQGVKIITGFSSHDPGAAHGLTNSYQGNVSFIAKNQLDVVLHFMRLGGGLQNSDDSVTVKGNFFGMSAGHELGVQISNLTEVDYSQLPTFQDNVNHRMYGYRGKCIMSGDIPFSYAFAPDSEFFCRDSLDTGDYVRDTCRDFIRQYLGIASPY